MKKLIALLLMLCIFATPALAFQFKFFGNTYKIGKTEQLLDNADIQEQQIRERVQVQEVLQEANQWKAHHKFIGDEFCIQTDERQINIKVTEDQQIEEIQTSSNCYQIQTTEQAMSQLFEKYQQTKYLEYKEIKEHVKIPFKLKWKVVTSGVLY